ncbi:hypothetical protein C8R45DRAFT_942375 [Mycena sanguinolenta]|nr:hypothetical protein C8R45DRAFT_942375 [Mycena sanguinolenta]
MAWQANKMAWQADKLACTAKSKPKPKQAIWRGRKPFWQAKNVTLDGHLRNHIAFTRGPSHRNPASADARRGRIKDLHLRAVKVTHGARGRGAGRRRLPLQTAGGRGGDLSRCVREVMCAPRGETTGRSTLKVARRGVECEVGAREMGPAVEAAAEAVSLGIRYPSGPASVIAELALTELPPNACDRRIMVSCLEGAQIPSLKHGVNSAEACEPPLEAHDVVEEDKTAGISGYGLLTAPTRVKALFLPATSSLLVQVLDKYCMPGYSSHSPQNL